MKICVTGAGGFIGRYVLRSLRSRLRNGVDTILATDKPDELSFEGAEYVPCDLRPDRSDYYELLRRPDSVIHLAWEGLPNYNELFHLERNLPTSYRFLKQMIENGTKNVTVIGTCFEYGLQDGCLKETVPTNPATTYGLAKNCLRLYLEELQKHYPFNLKWVRLFYLYGQGQSKNSLLELLKSALDRGDQVFNMSGGEQLRDYLPVETVAENIVRIALQNKVCGPINNCSGKPMSVRRLVEDYLHVNGRNIELNLGYYPYPDYEPFAFWGNTEKLRTIIE